MNSQVYKINTSDCEARLIHYVTTEILLSETYGSDFNIACVLMEKAKACFSSHIAS